ncbi:MAG: exodeoxyribonuclease V subunit gamma [Microlunatus sp.]
MSLQLHRAERSDRLVAGLADLLVDPLPDPFASEVVAVPTRGVERWLAQQLSNRLGVCAGVEFPSVRRLVADTLASVAEIDSDDDPWHPDRAVWSILAIIDAAQDETWAQLLWSHLRGRSAEETRSGRRWLTARRAATLFARYASERPELLERWRHGADVDSAGNPLGADRAWQAELWRRLRGELGTPSPDERLPDALDRIAAGEVVVGLPERLSVFGLTGLDRTQHQVLSALAAQRDVHLWLTHPSPALWDALATRSPAPPGRRSADTSLEAVNHRLLGYLGRDSRELQLVLAAAQPHDEVVPGLTADRPRQSTLLSQLQHDIAANAAPVPTAERPLLSPDDRSLQVHAAHGPDRQVEVLRELLVGLLEEDPTLEPRDMVVLCPDIERFAPLISAVFGLAEEDGDTVHPGHRIRVRLADRALRRVNPLLAVLSEVLGLAGGRLEASAVLDLCAQPSVARRFGFTTEDLDRLAQLVSASGVRWGLDAAHRRPCGLEHFGQNTWAAGLDRMLLGVAMDGDGDHFIGTALPLDEVDSSDVDLVGRLAELLDRLGTALDAFDADHPTPRWLELARHTIDALTETTPSDSWQTGHAYRVLSSLTGDESTAPAVLNRAEFQALLADRLGGRAGRANFRTGTLTVCTMYPMRSVPHRVVCLLGMDDLSFPRRTRDDGDDVLAGDPWVGDRDRRSEDRQLLLDAIMSATEHLIVLYSGADPRTGASRPPAVPIGELLDAVDLTVRTADGVAPSEAVVRRHPLQPFDAANFVAEPLSVGEGRPFSFDQAALRGARAAAGERTGGPAVYPTTPLPDRVRDPQIELTDLVRFLSHPVKALLRERAGLPTWEETDPVTDNLAVELDGLESWEIGNRLLTELLRGADPDQLSGAEWRRGTLPPRALGGQVLNRLMTQATEIADRARPWASIEPTSRDIALAVGDRLLVGTVGPLHGPTLLSVGYSWLGAKQRLAAFTRLLALTAAHPDTPWQAVTIGRRGTSVLGPVDPGWAALVLDDQLDLYGTGLREPLPFAPRSSAEYARLRWRDQQVSPTDSPVAKEWDRDRDSAYERFFGTGVTLAELLAIPSRAAEERGTLAEPSRFGTLARRVFHPLLTAEELR